MEAKQAIYKITNVFLASQVNELEQFCEERGLTLRVEVN